MQNYANHGRIDPGFHRVLIPALALTLLAAIINVVHSFGVPERFHVSATLLALTACVLAAALYARIYALKAQDRAIRADENLRHYVLTGKLLDPRLSVKQVVALRFASDAELAALAARAAGSSLSPKAIKQAIKTWRADDYRV
jgi:hypothetical protein